MVRIMEEVLKACLKQEYQELGFKLYQIDDHILALDFGNKPVAPFCATGATVAGVNEACKLYLEIGRAVNSFIPDKCPHAIGKYTIGRCDYLNVCDLNSKICLLESGLHCETYEEYLKEQKSE